MLVQLINHDGLLPCLSLMTLELTETNSNSAMLLMDFEGDGLIRVQSF
jgi:hypothetical protein